MHPGTFGQNVVNFAQMVIQLLLYTFLQVIFDWNILLLSSIQSVENCVCILRNLSYHVHKEIPGAERFQEPHATHLMRSVGHQKKKNETDCFGGKRPKGSLPVMLDGINMIY